MKFPSLPRINPGEDPADKLNQWATFIEQLAKQITFEDNFEQIITTKQCLLNSSFDVSLSSLSPTKSYNAVLVSSKILNASNILLEGTSIDYSVNTSTRNITIYPRATAIYCLNDDTPPVMDNILVEVTVQILGVDNG